MIGHDTLQNTLIMRGLPFNFSWEIGPKSKHDFLCPTHFLDPQWNKPTLKQYYFIKCKRTVYFFSLDSI